MEPLLIISKFIVEINIYIYPGPQFCSKLLISIFMPNECKMNLYTFSLHFHIKARHKEGTDVHDLFSLGSAQKTPHELNALKAQCLVFFRHLVSCLATFDLSLVRAAADALHWGMLMTSSSFSKSFLKNLFSDSVNIIVGTG